MQLLLRFLYYEILNRSLLFRTNKKLAILSEQTIAYFDNLFYSSSGYQFFYNAMKI